MSPIIHGATDRDLGSALAARSPAQPTVVDLEATATHPPSPYHRYVTLPSSCWPLRRSPL